MAKVTAVAESSRLSREEFLTEERLLNLYPVPSPDGGRSRLMFRSVLGYTAHATIGTTVLRTLAAVNGTLYAVASGQLHRIASDGTVTALAAVVDSTLTTLSVNGMDTTIAAGGTYYVWDGSALSTPGSGRIGTVGSVAYINGRTLLSESGGDEWEWTAVADATSRSALNFASAETQSDYALRAVTVGSNVWVIGDESIEMFGATDQDGADAFVRISGGVVKRGCLGPLLNVVFDPGDGSGDNLWWVGDDKVPYRATGISPQPLPRSGGVVAAIEAEEPTHCFFYEDQGHKFFVVRFAGRPAWCYDASTGFWHERSSGVDHGAWDVIATTKVGGIWYAATATGTIYKLARTNTDISEPLKRTLVFRPIDFGGRQFRVSRLEMVANAGAGDIGRDVQMMLRAKRDRRPWGPEDWRTLGDLGEYGTRAIWNGLGTQTVATYEASITDAADISILSDANIDL